MSRMNVQEIIASEAYIMAESLEKIHIPVRVLTFRTIRGITVLERLRNTKEKSSGRIFRFFSGGWNRDGLAFRALGSLLEAERGEKEQLLIVLTDACPNDDMPALMDPSGRALKEYEGVTAVSDTEKAVHDLREAGIRTAAVFFGSVSHLENVQQIYGKEYVRIRKLNRIADAAQDLIRMTLQEMTLQI
jgi:nitric oxide reductase activation protein